MYISAKHIGIKSNQDRASFSTIKGVPHIIICDGIGQYKDSGKVAEYVTSNFFTQLEEMQLSDFLKSIPNNLKKQNIEGGTTLIIAKVEESSISFSYLGNGGIIHLKGDFYNNPVTDLPFRYTELLNPDVTPSGKLIKHISHNSSEQELLTTNITLNPCSVNGDIFLLFSDGISTLEDNVIVKGDNSLLWRNEPLTINFILNYLHSFLSKKENHIEFENKLIELNSSILETLNRKQMVEDDTSLGIIITDKVLEYYKKEQSSE
jgi:hypothetical protein